MSVTLIFSAKVAKLLDALVATSLYGSDRGEVCERLISQALEEKLEMILAYRRMQS